MILGLVAGRHEIPGVEEYIFDSDFFVNGDDIFDYDRIIHRIHEVLSKTKTNEVTLYVTGLTVALVEVINYCINNLVDLKLMHFDRDTGSYREQRVLSALWKGHLYDGGFIQSV